MKPPGRLVVFVVGVATFFQLFLNLVFLGCATNNNGRGAFVPPKLDSKSQRQLDRYGIRTEYSSYKHWRKAIFMSNGNLEVVVVPDVGGVVQMFFEDQDDGPFYIEPLSANTTQDAPPPPPSVWAGEQFVFSPAAGANSPESEEGGPVDWKFDVRNDEIVLTSEGEPVFEKRIGMSIFDPVLRVSAASGWNMSGPFHEPAGLILRLRRSGVVYADQPDEAGQRVIRPLIAVGDTITLPIHRNARLVWMGDSQALLVDVVIPETWRDPAGNISLVVRESPKDPELLEVEVASSMQQSAPDFSTGMKVTYRLFKRENEEAEDMAREILNSGR